MRAVDYLADLFQRDLRGPIEGFCERVGPAPAELFTGGLWRPWWPSVSLSWKLWGAGIRAGKPCPVESQWDREAWDTVSQLHADFIAATT